MSHELCLKCIHQSHCSCRRIITIGPDGEVISTIVRDGGAQVDILERLRNRLGEEGQSVQCARGLHDAIEYIRDLRGENAELRRALEELGAPAATRR